MTDPRVTYRVLIGHEHLHWAETGQAAHDSVAATNPGVACDVVHVGPNDAGAAMGMSSRLAPVCSSVWPHLGCG
jgi:hypothetical protein